MYDNLGIHWASCIPAFLALLCVPFPFLFYKYGAEIRSKCKYAAEAAAFLEELRASSGPAKQTAPAEAEPIIGPGGNEPEMGAQAGAGIVNEKTTETEPDSGVVKEKTAVEENSTVDEKSEQ